MKKDIAKYQRWYKRQLISAEEFLMLAVKSTMERVLDKEISFHIGAQIITNITNQVNEEENRKFRREKKEVNKYTK